MIPIKLKALSDLVTHNRGQLIYCPFSYDLIVKTINHDELYFSPRQLEAVVRMSESLAKMQLQPFATEVHVDESLRLFQVSTLDAAMSGSLAGRWHHVTFAQ